MTKPRIETITLEEIRSVLDYDSQTGIFKWLVATCGGCHRPRPIGTIAGCVHKSKYRVIGINGRVYMAHRLAWFCAYGYWPDQIDHRDCNPDNNAIENLREATTSQNQANTRPKQTLKGVTRLKTGRWQAGIKVQGKYIYLGLFDSPEQGHAAYAAAAQKHFGEFARPA